MAGHDTCCRPISWALGSFLSIHGRTKTIAYLDLRSQHLAKHLAKHLAQNLAQHLACSLSVLGLAGNVKWPSTHLPRDLFLHWVWKRRSVHQHQHQHQGRSTGQVVVTS